MPGIADLLYRQGILAYRYRNNITDMEAGLFQPSAGQVQPGHPFIMMQPWHRLVMQLDFFGLLILHSDVNYISLI